MAWVCTVRSQPNFYKFSSSTYSNCSSNFIEFGPQITKIKFIGGSMFCQISLVSTYYSENFIKNRSAVSFIFGGGAIMLTNKQTNRCRQIVKNNNFRFLFIFYTTGSEKKRKRKKKKKKEKRR